MSDWQWQPGDRVRLLLPHKASRKRALWFTGTVRTVNEPGQQPGVRIDLDEEVNGVRDCYATHRELHRI